MLQKWILYEKFDKHSLKELRRCHFLKMKYFCSLSLFSCDCQMEIVCEHQQFRILVDGQPLCGFTHRLLPLASLTALRVIGDLQLTKVA